MIIISIIRQHIKNHKKQKLCHNLINKFEKTLSKMSTFIIDLTLESENVPRVAYNGEVIDLTHDSDEEVIEEEVIRWNRRKRCLDKTRPRKFMRYNEDDEEDIEDGSFSVASTEISIHQSDKDFLDDGEESIQSSEESFHLENIQY